MRPASGKERTGQTARHRRNSFFALTFAFVATLVGCGETNRDEIESALKGFDSALAVGDGRKACGFLSESTRVEIERRGDCEKLAAGLSRPDRRTAPEVRALASGRVSNVMLEGTVATAQVQAPGGYPAHKVELEEIEGGWKISKTPLGP